MHMSDALITPVVGGTMLATSGGVMGYSIRSLKVEIFEKRLPLMAVMGAFLFAAQMINFAIPGTGSSGHIGGGMLLAIILGPAAGFLTMACVLLIQALFFADGGLLAYGCNLINLGFFTAFVAYPLVFKPMISKGISRRKLMWASMIASVIGLQLGSLGVVVETYLSGTTDLTLGMFLTTMQGIHLAIGLIEGFITGTIVYYLYGQNPNMIYSEVDKAQASGNFKRLLVTLIVMALLIGGFVSHFASASPDGLEWAIERTVDAEALNQDSDLVQKLEAIQGSIAPLPDYGFEDETIAETIGTTTSGLLGSLITLGLTLLLGLIIRRRQKRNEAV